MGYIIKRYKRQGLDVNQGKSTNKEKIVPDFSYFNKKATL